MNAMCVHLAPVLGEDVKEYLFNRNFDCNNVKHCEDIDQVIFLDALIHKKTTESSKDLNRVNHAIFKCKLDAKEVPCHPFAKLMHYKLQEKLTPQEQNELNDELVLPTYTHHLDPPSGLTLELDDADEVRPGVDPDSCLMSHLI